MLHELKIDYDYFGPVNKGEKLFELRKDDRGFRVGDFLWLRAIGKDGTYVGPELVVQIKYILRDYEGLKEGYCIIGFESCQKWRVGK